MNENNGVVYFGEYAFTMFQTTYNLGDTYVDIYLSNKNTSLDEIESVVQSPKNLKEIKIFDSQQALVIKFNNKFTVYDSLCTIPSFKYAEYNNNGEREPQYTKVIKLTLKMPTPESELQKMQATMEYMAIMSDIDIDEEI